MKIKKWIGVLLFSTTLVIAACSNNSDKGMDHEKKDRSHQSMQHSNSKEVPKNLSKATNPKFEVGSKAIIAADHMKGMDGAIATIVGAYDTTAYVVSYTPTTGGKKVNDHKWVIQQEIKNAGNKTLERGKTVSLDADHMKGMDGAKAEIDSSEHTTVYMVDYTPTTGGKEVKNHKWITESELKEK